MIRVMIVEDDPMVADINKRYVEAVEGFCVVGTAKNGKIAYDIIPQLKPDLIILDVFMPRCNGLDLLKKVRQEGLGIDTILVTASTDADHISQVLHMGAFDYLVKPFQFERLKKSLESYRLRKKALDEKSNVSQEEIDNFIMVRQEDQADQIYHKGINPKTMETIQEFMALQHEPMDAETVAKGIGVTRVTARRYLENMAKDRKLQRSISYETGGRPRNLYFKNTI